VASIRAASAELVGYAHITNYQLTYNGTVLDDYGDLSILQQQQQEQEQPPKDTPGQIQMELKPYQTVREHVLRLQHWLDGNPPVVKALVETESPPTSDSPTKTGTGTKTKPEPQSTAVPSTPPSDELSHSRNGSWIQEEQKERTQSQL
jgi:hypothetical protein